jgi:hypothetical protein
VAFLKGFSSQCYKVTEDFPGHAKLDIENVIDLSEVINKSTDPLVQIVLETNQK